MPSELLGWRIFITLAKKRKKRKKLGKKGFWHIKCIFSKKKFHHFHEIKMYQQVCSKVDAHTAFFFSFKLAKWKIKSWKFKCFWRFWITTKSEGKNSKNHWIPVFVFYYIAKYMKGWLTIYISFLIHSPDVAKSS